MIIVYFSKAESERKAPIQVPDMSKPSIYHQVQFYLLLLLLLLFR